MYRAMDYFLLYIQPLLTGPSLGAVAINWVWLHVEIGMGSNEIPGNLANLLCSLSQGLKQNFASFRQNKKHWKEEQGVAAYQNIDTKIDIEETLVY